MSILTAFKRENPGIVYMRDEAPSHFARQKIENLHTVGNHHRMAPLFSRPQSNGELWKCMKNFLQSKFSEPD